MDGKAQIVCLGISICPNSSVAVSGAMKLRNNGIIKKDDDAGTAPGSTTLIELFSKFGPAVIIIDELSKYASNIYGKTKILNEVPILNNNKINHKKNLKKFKILFVGRLLYWKGLDLVLETFKALIEISVPIP